MAHVIDVLVKVESMWVQDLGFSHESSRRLLSKPLNISYRTKVAQNESITHINFVTHTSFVIEISVS